MFIPLTTPANPSPPPHPYYTAGCGLITLGRLLNRTSGRPDRYWLATLQGLMGVTENGWHALWAAKSRADFLQAEDKGQVRRLLGPIEAALIELTNLHRELCDTSRAMGVGERATVQLDWMASYRGELYRCGWELHAASRDRGEMPTAIPEHPFRATFGWDPLGPVRDVETVHVVDIAGKFYGTRGCALKKGHKSNDLVRETVAFRLVWLAVRIRAIREGS